MKKHLLFCITILSCSISKPSEENPRAINDTSDTLDRMTATLDRMTGTLDRIAATTKEVQALLEQLITSQNMPKK